LTEDNLAFNELDIDYLDVNFLEDLLEVIEELDALAIAEQRGASSFFQNLIYKVHCLDKIQLHKLLTFGDAEKITTYS